MNILHMKYAVEVARAGSINKAAESLLVAQPNLSRSIKELESDLGISIFDRSARGMILTPEGEEFVEYARKILGQIDEVETIFRSKRTVKRRFSLMAPGAGYIAKAFVEFCADIGTQDAELSFREAGAFSTIRSVATSDSRLGIIRYPQQQDRYFKAALEEKGLVYELAAEFRQLLVASTASPLAGLQEVCRKDLEELIEISQYDLAPSPAPEPAREERPAGAGGRRVSLSERATQLELLAANPSAYTLCSPVPEQTLRRFGLVQLPLEQQLSRPFKDLLIRRRDYRLTALDDTFVTTLCRCRREVLG